MLSGRPIDGNRSLSSSSSPSLCLLVEVVFASSGLKLEFSLRFLSPESGLLRADGGLLSLLLLSSRRESILIVFVLGTPGRIVGYDERGDPLHDLPLGGRFPLGLPLLRREGKRIGGGGGSLLLAPGRVDTPADDVMGS
eukprot:scaffold117541_cov42-Prasinocladus_malaysianus.AAC.1